MPRLAVAGLRRSLMDLDPLDLIADDSDADTQAPPRDRAHRLNAAVAITVALLATFMGICKVKDDNIVQAMQQAQADKIDDWAFYQARNVRQEIAQSTLTQLELQRAALPVAAQAAYAGPLARYEALAKEQAAKKEELRRQALAAQATYDALNYRDDQFDLSDTLIAIAISLLAVSSLTQLPWLYFLSLVPAGLGVLMGVAGLAGLHIHPDRITALLS